MQIDSRPFTIKCTDTVLLLFRPYFGIYLSAAVGRRDTERCSGPLSPARSASHYTHHAALNIGIGWEHVWEILRAVEHQSRGLKPLNAFVLFGFVATSVPASISCLNVDRIHSNNFNPISVSFLASLEMS